VTGLTPPVGGGWYPDKALSSWDEVAPMPGCADQTAYYFSREPPRIALIGRGVRFPAGIWLRIADERLSPSVVQELLPSLFPALEGRTVAFVTLLTEFDVQEFEIECESSV
jgi:hypothetical protein